METDNHKLNVPAKGAYDWAAQFNENFESLDTKTLVVDREMHVAEGTYTPHTDAVFLAWDTGAVYRGDGGTWQKIGGIPDTSTHTASGDGSVTTFVLSHDLFSEPSTVQVTPTSEAAAAAHYVSGRSDGDVTVEYLQAPPDGTDNLSWDLTVEA